MIKAKGLLAGRRPTIFLGLEFDSMDKLKQRKTVIMIRKEDMQIDHDIVIFAGRDHEELFKTLRKGINEHTIIHTEA